MIAEDKRRTGEVGAGWQGKIGEMQAPPKEQTGARRPTFYNSNK